MKTLAVQPWPGPAPAPQDGLFAILIRIESRVVSPTSAPLPSGAATQTAGPAPAASQRDIARRAIRLAAREALAAVLGLPPEAISIASTPGSAPSILLAGRQQTIGISFAHDGNYTLAAINLHGPIGADLMRVQTIADWQTVASDYLGPAATAALLAATPESRPAALAKAWTRREACLKLHGQQLSEWQAELPGQAIALPLTIPGMMGHIAIPT